jgi:phospholipid/cholesterol/gamma-HCH transport system substrate-binding protein
MVAGVFVIVMTVGLVLAALWLSRESVDRVPYLVVAKIPVSGLHTKAAVRLRGVEIGKVDKIEFDRKDPRTILIDVDVDRSATLTQGTFGQLNYQGVTGLSFVELDDDGSNPQPLATSTEQPGQIELRPSLLDQIGGSGQSLLADASIAAKQLNRLLSDENLAQLAAALRSTQVASAQIGALASQLQPTARSLPALEARTDEAVGQLNLLLGEMRSVTSEFDRHLTSLDEVGRAALAVSDASRSLQSSVVGDTLPRISGAIEELSHTSRSLDRVLKEVEDRPQSLLFGRARPPGPGEPGFAPPGAR